MNETKLYMRNLKKFIDKTNNSYLKMKIIEKYSS